MSDQQSQPSTTTQTCRSVRFTCHRHTTATAFDQFFDACPGWFWDTWRERLFGTVLIAATGVTVEVSGWPWWVPDWATRRSITALAARSSVRGTATHHVERHVLDALHQYPKENSDG